MSCAAAILAAGESRRLGSPKQLLPFRGTTLLREVAREVCGSACDRVGVVVGAHAARAAEAIDALPVEIVHNVLWSEGIAASVRCATAWAIRARCESLVLIVCDQPHLTAAHVDRLLVQHRIVHRPVASGYSGTVGVPAVFGAAEYPELLALAGDCGARRVLGRTRISVVDWPAGACDIDTPRVARDVLGA